MKSFKRNSLALASNRLQKRQHLVDKNDTANMLLYPPFILSTRQCQILINNQKPCQPKTEVNPFLICIHTTDLSVFLQGREFTRQPDVSSDMLKSPMNFQFQTNIVLIFEVHPLNETKSIAMIQKNTNSPS